MQNCRYPTVFLNSVYNDGTVGLNDTEADSDVKQTIQSLAPPGYEVSDGIKTIYCSIEDAAFNADSFTDALLESTISRLWFIKTRSDSGNTNTYSYVDVLSFLRSEDLRLMDQEQQLISN